MTHRLLVTLLIVSLTGPGCASQRTFLPPNQDPKELTATIAVKGQSNSIVANPKNEDEEERLRATAIMVTCLETTGLVAGAALYLALKAAYAMAPSTQNKYATASSS
jgi:hypothetical protein